jgi:hypothetical protein
MRCRATSAVLPFILAGVLAALLLLPAGAAAYAPYHVPAHRPPVHSPHVRELLRGSRLTSSQGWIVVSLRGAPYRIGFQNGFLTAQSTHYSVLSLLGAPGTAYRTLSRRIARVAWTKVPKEYQSELRGISDGLHAAGYRSDSLWDVVASNDWADQDCYKRLLRGATSSAAPAAPRASLLRRGAKGGCSAFIASGTATADGLPVMGHNTWAGYQYSFQNNVLFYVHPTHGYAFTFQSSGGQIWSGEDWYENSAGLLLTETTLADTTHKPQGRPVFVRAREAAQYASTVQQCIDTLRTRSNGAYSNEWLMGDSTGTIASLQLGCRRFDLNVTRNGFFGSSNFDWGPNTRSEEGDIADPYNPAVVDYARHLRWGQLAAQYNGTIDAAVGRSMESDTYDSYLGEQRADARCLCGEPERGTPGLLRWDDWVDEPCGALDAKVTTEAMATSGLQQWARWGHPSGDAFNAGAFLRRHSAWRKDNGSFELYGLRTFARQTPNEWTLVGGL